MQNKTAVQCVCGSTFTWRDAKLSAVFDQEIYRCGECGKRIFPNVPIIKPQVPKVIPIPPTPAKRALPVKPDPAPNKPRKVRTVEKKPEAAPVTTELPPPEREVVAYRLGYLVCPKCEKRMVLRFDSWLCEDCGCQIADEPFDAIEVRLVKKNRAGPTNPA